MTCAPCNNVAMYVRRFVGRIMVGFSYEVVPFYKFVGHLIGDKWEVLLNLVWCNVSTVSDL